MADQVLNEAVLVQAFDAVSARYLGRGTFGETWCVEGIPSLPASCAVKVLIPQTFNPRRLQREVDGLLRFDFPGIMKLYEVRDVEIDGVARTALLCEHIDGGDLSSMVTNSGLPTHKQLGKFAVGLLGAVSELHASDTWHRDLKPANILLRDGKWSEPVLIDFGLSRASSDATMTVYPQQVGTLLYMAPEALKGEQARKQADLWSCGVVLYELISGHHPYVTDTAGLLPDDVVDLVVGAPIPLPDGVPAELRDLVLRLLSHAPHERGSAERAVNDLRK